MDWFRWHRGTVNDPKLKVIARKAGQPLTTVIAVWASMLETANENSPRGSLKGWDIEATALSLDVTQEVIKSVYDAMQGRTLKKDALAAWKKRNPKREDDSRDRVSAYRARRKKNENSADVTQGNAPVTHGNSRVEESREEESRVEKKLPAGARRARARVAEATLPDEWAPNDLHRALAEKLGLDIEGEAERFRDHAKSTGRKMLDWDATFRTWMRKSEEYIRVNGPRINSRNGKRSEASDPNDWASKLELGKAG